MEMTTQHQQAPIGANKLAVKRRGKTIFCDTVQQNEKKDLEEEDEQRGNSTHQ